MWNPMRMAPKDRPMIERRFVMRLQLGRNIMTRDVPLGWRHEMSEEEQKEILWDAFRLLEWEMERVLRPQEFNE